MKYYAFISYKREDERWAIWLQNKLERYRLPSILCRERKIPRRLQPVCRDKTDLSTGGLLQSLHDKLDDSRFLIVICSPVATKSVYIDQEIEYFASKYGKEKICPLIVQGTPYSNDSEECYPLALRNLFPTGSHQLLGANIAEDGQGSKYKKKQRAFIMILSHILGVSFDSLWQRHKKYLIRYYSIILATACSLLFTPILVWNRTKEFDINLSLEESSPTNNNLPIPSGEVTIKFQSDTLVQMLDSVSCPVYFRNIPGKIKGKELNVRTQIFGFQSLDTLVSAERLISLTIYRDPECYGRIEGIIRNLRDQLVSGAVITIQDVSTTSDFNGHFQLTIPLYKQQPTYHAIVSINGCITNVDSIYPMQGNPLLVNTIYIEDRNALTGSDKAI